jgi:predicted DNA-binding transcriptional regulator AlpA
MGMLESPFMTSKAAADRLGLSESTLEKLRHKGGGPPFLRLSGRRIAYDVVDLDAWARAKRFGSTSEYPAKSVRRMRHDI